MEFDPRVIGNKILPNGEKKTGIGNFIRKTSPLSVRVYIRYSILTESSKSPAAIAKSNKQWVGVSFVPPSRC